VAAPGWAWLLPGPCRREGRRGAGEAGAAGDFISPRDDDAHEVITIVARERERERERESSD
jgi:hypothetical protein